MAVLNRKLKASSLIEVVIAAVIILASFTTAMSILSKTAGENDVLHRIELNNSSNDLFNKQKAGEFEQRGMLIQSSIDNTGDILSEQRIAGKKQDGELHKRIFTRRRLIQTQR